MYKILECYVAVYVNNHLYSIRQIYGPRIPQTQQKTRQLTKQRNLFAISTIIVTDIYVPSLMELKIIKNARYHY